jgi:spermidine/putrescine transport system permease protein
LIEAAHNLGAPRWRTIVTVVIPTAKVGLALGAAFSFMLAFGDFVSPTFLGGGKAPTLSIMVIDTVKSASDWPRASVIALVMVITLMVVLLATLAFAYSGRGRSR